MINDVRCDYCNESLDFTDDKLVKNYIPELNSIYCDECINRYEKSIKNGDPRCDADILIDEINEGIRSGKI